MSQENPIGFLEDSNGDRSSKRLWGSILLSIGVLFAMVLFSASLFITIADPLTAIKIIEWLFMCGGGLLGIGVLEGLKKS